MPFLNLRIASTNINSTSIDSLCPICSTSLSSVSGKPSLLIYFAFFMHMEMRLFTIWTRGSLTLVNYLKLFLPAWNRFRQIPTFGRDTIRKFSNNASAMKKLAARDFEDLLQVCIMSLVWYYVLTPDVSAPFPFSRVYCQRNMTKLYRSFSLSWQLGMA